MGQVALFRLGNEPFAVAGGTVGRIAATPRLFRLPLLCPEIFGVFVRDDQPVYLLDLLRIYDFPSDLTLDMAENVLICRSEAGQIGLPATQLERIVAVEAGALEEAGRGDFSRMNYHFLLDDQKYQLVDVDALVSTLLR